MPTAAEWLDRWERQQGHHVADRESRFDAIVRAVATLGDAPFACDLGCGPGSLGRRIVDAVPGATVIGLDADPVLLHIGREALRDRAPRLRLLDVDLRDDWTHALEGRQLDAAVSSTALHWLRADDLITLYRRLAAVMRPGGLLLNGDRVEFDGDEPTIAATARAMRERELAAAPPPPPGTEPWDAWWAAATADPSLAGPVAERERRHHDHPEHDHHATLAWHRDALRGAGFGEVGTIWQRGASRVLVAVR